MPPRGRHGRQLRKEGRIHYVRSGVIECDFVPDHFVPIGQTCENLNPLEFNFEQFLLGLDGKLIAGTNRKRVGSCDQSARTRKEKRIRPATLAMPENVAEGVGSADTESREPWQDLGVAAARLPARAIKAGARTMDRGYL